MFGPVLGGSPTPSRWGNGVDGAATWSGAVTKAGLYQFTELTISDSSLIKVGTSGLYKNGLVVFASRAITIGNSVEFNAQPNSNTYKGTSSWTSSGYDTSDVHCFSGGGGGGGYGTNCSGYSGLVGNDPAIYYTTSLGTVWGNVLNTDGTPATGGSGFGNSAGHSGGAGYTVSSSIITNNFGFTTATISGHDDFPVVRGGDGGRGGNQSNCEEYQTEGAGGTGGGMILLIAPKITFGSGVVLNAYGNTRGEGDDGCSSANKNMNGATLGDGGSGGGGGGGGGLIVVIYNTATGSYTTNVAGGTGGYGLGKHGHCNGGNRGGWGGTGGNGIALKGSRGYLTGNISWL